MTSEQDTGDGPKSLRANIPEFEIRPVPKDSYSNPGTPKVLQLDVGDPFKSWLKKLSKAAREQAVHLMGDRKGSPDTLASMLFEAAVSDIPSRHAIESSTEPAVTAARERLRDVDRRLHQDESLEGYSEFPVFDGSSQASDLEFERERAHWGVVFAFVAPRVLRRWEHINAHVIGSNRAIAFFRERGDEIAQLTDAGLRLAEATREELVSDEFQKKTESLRDAALVLAVHAYLYRYSQDGTQSEITNALSSLKMKAEVDALAFDGTDAATWVATVLWHARVRDELQRNADRGRGIVRIPEASKTLAHARVFGGIEVGQRQGILVEPPTGAALLLPFDDGLQVANGKGRISLRQVLPPQALRDWVATLVAYQDQGSSPDGGFYIDGPDTILDITGASRHAERKGKATYSRFATKDRKAVLNHLALFPKIRVIQAGDLEALAGDPLVDEIRQKKTGKTCFHQHSRLIIKQHHCSYARVPREACRLAPADIPLALGIAQILREKVVLYFRTGHIIEAQVVTWAHASGIESEGNELRKHGVTEYFRRVAEDVARVAEAGNFGSVRIQGSGRETVLSLRPTQLLLENYKPLLEAANALSLIHI